MGKQRWLYGPRIEAERFQMTTLDIHDVGKSA